MAYRTRIRYTSAQKQEIWNRWEKGESLSEEKEAIVKGATLLRA
jgi:hypothetical protein